MIHKHRIFQIVEEVTDIAYLSETLTQHTWTLCTAFRLVPALDAASLLFLNDSFSENSAQEYAVIRDNSQIESITFSWCSQREAYNHIASLVRGGGVDCGPLEPRLEPADTHMCPLCRSIREARSVQEQLGLFTQEEQPQYTVPERPPERPLRIPIYRVTLVRERTLEHYGTVRSSADVSQLLREYLAGADREHFVVLMVDKKNRVIGINTVSVGSLDSSIVHPREV